MDGWSNDYGKVNLEVKNVPQYSRPLGGSRVFLFTKDRSASAASVGDKEANRDDRLDGTHPYAVRRPTPPSGVAEIPARNRRRHARRSKFT
jgi:hypothetical protein